MSVTDELVENAGAWAAGFNKGDLALRPTKRLAIVACMDSRLALFAMLGLRKGEAHILRNAGGIISADVERSLAISQHLLGTREIMLIHHTDCGMLKMSDPELRTMLRKETGSEPRWEVEWVGDAADDVRHSIARIESSPFILHKNVRGFVYEVETGRLREVEGAAA